MLWLVLAKDSDYEGFDLYFFSDDDAKGGYSEKPIEKELRPLFSMPYRIF
jgi:hypothetical protein